jgi:hypothetical protein
MAQKKQRGDINLLGTSSGAGRRLDQVKNASAGFLALLRAFLSHPTVVLSYADPTRARSPIITKAHKDILLHCCNPGAVSGSTRPRPYPSAQGSAATAAVMAVVMRGVAPVVAPLNVPCSGLDWIASAVTVKVG